MDNNTWIKINRKLLEWEWFADPRMVQVWLYLLMTATPFDTRFKGVILKRGQIATNNSKIAIALNCERETIARALKKLDDCGCIKFCNKNGDKYKIITICKYAQYQYNVTENTAGDAAGSAAGDAAGHRIRYIETNRELLTNNSPVVHNSSLPSSGNDENEVADDGINYANLAKYWNESTKGRYGKIISIANNRRKMVRARIRTYGKETFKTAIDSVANNTFFADKNWFNFDWFIRPNNFDKIIAGNYNERKAETQSGHPLGEGEYINSSGIRTYGTGRAVIPADAPPRPTARHFWNKEAQQWQL